MMVSSSKKILLTFFGLMFLLGCGSDVDPGKIEGAPRSSESIYKQDLNFFRTKDALLGEDSSETSQILFGDLHVHTALSLDANTQGTILTPEDAYLYAKGQPLYLQPYNPDGTSSRVSRLNKPLDFAAVTDHAELLGEVRMCTDPDSQYFNHLTCRFYRDFPRLSYFYINAKASLGKSLGMCGNNRELCLAEAQVPWLQTIEAAEKHYDRSELSLIHI